MIIYCGKRGSNPRPEIGALIGLAIAVVLLVLGYLFPNGF